MNNNNNKTATTTMKSFGEKRMNKHQKMIRTAYVFFGQISFGCTRIMFLSGEYLCIWKKLVHTVQTLRIDNDTGRLYTREWIVE